jgi:hypothetical protein
MDEQLIAGDFMPDELMAETTWADTKTQRLIDMRSHISDDMKGVLEMLSEYQDNISNAKTSTKRQYLKKKIVKLRPQIMEMLSLTQRVDHMIGEAKKKELTPDAN